MITELAMASVLSKTVPCCHISTSATTKLKISKPSSHWYAKIILILGLCKHFYLFQKSFDQLTHLDLFNNDICNLEDYRTKVFKLLPNLKYLDDTDADDNDEEESDEGEDGVNGAEEEDDGEGEDDDDDDDDEEGEEEESDEEDDEDEGEMTLSDLYNKKLDDDEDGEDFVEDGEEEEDDDEIDDEDEPSTKKPKVDNSGDAN